MQRLVNGSMACGCGLAIGFGSNGISVSSRRGIDDGQPQPVDFPDELFLLPLRQLAVVRVMRLLDGLVRRADDFRPAPPAVGADAPLRAFGPGMPARAF